jgi:Ala-tRNA(Pro) deacylase
MAIAMTLSNYLDQLDIDYDIVFHPKSHGSLHSARLAHVPPDCMAKPVVLEDDGGYVMAVIPSSRRVQLGMLSQELQRPLRLAQEHELGKLFGDCQLGAVPPIGAAYGVETLLDNTLSEMADIYFEAGDHEELIHVKGAEFVSMMAGARRGRFTRPATDGKAAPSEVPESLPGNFYGS